MLYPTQQFTKSCQVINISPEKTERAELLDAINMLLARRLFFSSFLKWHLYSITQYFNTEWGLEVQIVMSLKGNVVSLLVSHKMQSFFDDTNEIVDKTACPDTVHAACRLLSITCCSLYLGHKLIITAFSSPAECFLWELCQLSLCEELACMSQAYTPTTQSACAWICPLVIYFIYRVLNREMYVYDEAF